MTESDFEDRVSAALRDHAGQAPPAVALAQSARQRFRARRRRTTAVAVGGAVLAMAVPIGVVTLSRSGAGPLTVADAPSVTSPSGTADVPGASVAPGWRKESYGGVTFTVPDSWAYGSLTSWCAGTDGEQPVPRVSFPEDAELGTPSPAGIACLNPGRGYGVEVTRRRGQGDRWPQAPTYTTEGYPAGAWVASKRVEDVDVRVIGTDRATTARIWASIRVDTYATDEVGCPIPRTGGLPVFDGSLPDGAGAVCTVFEGELVHSERLTPEQVAQVSRDLAAATRLDPPGPADRPCADPGPYPTVIVRASGTWVVPFIGCGESFMERMSAAPMAKVRVDRGRLTPEVLNWVVSPGVEVPLPADLPEFQRRVE